MEHVQERVVKFCAQSTWINVQKALMDGSLEETVSGYIKIQPVRAVFFRRSQLIQDGVVVDDGPTLEADQGPGEGGKGKQEEMTPDEDDEVAAEQPNEDGPDEDHEAESEDEGQTVESPADVDYESMTVAQLKELLKKDGKPVSGKKADLISRLSE